MTNANPYVRMTKVRIGLAALLIAWVAWPAAGQTNLPQRYRLADLKALQKAFVEIAQEVNPSVVAIRTYYVHKSGEDAESPVRAPVSQGSGFIIDDDGFIATNRHVLEEANDITVILHNGKRYDAEIHQTDVRSDLAVLKIEAEGLKPVRWGDVGDVRVGHWSFAVGNPFGMANDDGRMSVGLGTVTALGRSLTRRLAQVPNLQYYGNLIETSSPINPGNSGGPLFNIDAEVIGIVTAIETSSGVNEGAGFAIPIDKNTRAILDTLRSGEVVHYGFMAVTVQEVDRPRVRRVVDGRVYRGAQISSLTLRHGPAAKAGLKPGDIIIAVDGTPVENSDHLVRLVSFSPVGAKVEITFLRRGIKRNTTVKLGDRRELLGEIESE